MALSLQASASAIRVLDIVPRFKRGVFRSLSRRLNRGSTSESPPLLPSTLKKFVAIVSVPSGAMDVPPTQVGNVHAKSVEVPQFAIPQRG